MWLRYSCQPPWQQMIKPFTIGTAKYPQSQTFSSFASEDENKLILFQLLLLRKPAYWNPVHFWRAEAVNHLKKHLKTNTFSFAAVTRSRKYQSFTERQEESAKVRRAVKHSCFPYLQSSRPELCLHFLPVPASPYLSPFTFSTRAPTRLTL